MDSLHVGQQASCHLVRPPKTPAEVVRPRGRFHIEHWRDGKLVGDYDFHNAITNEGKNALLNIMFHAATQVTAWYLLLVDGASTPTLATSDTYAQINGSNGWDEFTSYSETTRQAWEEGAASSQSITNATAAVFNISASGSVYGAAVVGGGTAASTKSDAAGGGTLWATAQFSSGTVSVLSGDQLKVQYTVTA